MSSFWVLLLELGSKILLYFEKRDHFAHFPNFVLKHLCIRNYSSHELETWHEYSSIILLNSLEIPSHAPFPYGRAEGVHRSHSKMAVLCLSLATHHLGQEAHQNFMKKGSAGHLAQNVNCVGTFQAAPQKTTGLGL